MSCDKRVPLRQVHLDFHTSPDIAGIGSRFSKENFQAALKAGHLDSITVFAKCHHSMCYYPTEVGIRHPHLDFDLTGAMVDAAHEIGVRAPLYITVGWSHEDAQRHPEWHTLKEDGTTLTSKSSFRIPKDLTQPKPYGGWQMLCSNDNAYAEHIYALTEEVCQRYPVVDGLFYDICAAGGVCYCDSCVAGMRAEGYDPENEEDARAYFIAKQRLFMKKCADILHRYHPEATIFFNGCANQYTPQYHDRLSHFEMEDLPTAWGGYNKLPMRAKYFAKKNKGLIGMTGKFHLSWGEFGGFKSKEALKFEVAMMALYGAGASVGDHMHPDGEMEMQTYENIGYAYEYLETIAPFCYGGKPVTNLGVYPSPLKDTNEGLSNILLENQLDYDLVTDGNFEQFDTVIFPAGSVLSDTELTALENYLNNGGKLVLMADALVQDGIFAPDIGFAYQGASEYDCDYLLPVTPVGGLPNAPMLCNIPGHRVACDDATVLVERLVPYFNRTYEHFCGHKNTPHDKNAPRTIGIAKRGNVVYVAHDLAQQYLEYGSLFHKRYFIEALNAVYSGPLLQVQGLGSQGRCTVICQPDQHRYCINMVYASPVKRGKAEVIEDIVPLYNIQLALQTDKTVSRVYLGLTSEELPFEIQNGRVCFTVPALCCHASVVVEYIE